MTDAIVARDPAAAAELPRHLRPYTRLGGFGVGLLRGVGVAAVGTTLALLIDDPVFFLGGWTVLVLAYVVARRRRLAALMRRFEDDSHLLLAGEIERATAGFDALCRESRGVPIYHTLFVFYRALAELAAGHTRPALAMLVGVRDSGWFGRRGFLGGQRGVLHAQIAVAHALLGDHDAAALSLAQARREQPEARRGVLLVLEVIVLARAGRHRDALERIEADLAHAERLLPVQRLRLVHALRAFCETAIAGEYRAAASAPAAVEALHDSATRVALARYAQSWPELLAFLATTATA